jgi:two-component system, LytTR family, sensor kinase
MASTSGRKSILQNPHIWLLSGGVAIFFVLLTLLSYVNYGNLKLFAEFSSVFREGRIILVHMIVNMYFVYYTIRYFDKKFGMSFILRRYVLEIIFIAVAGFGINQVFNFLFVTWFVLPQNDLEALAERLHSMVIVSQVMILIAYIVFVGFRILKSLRQKQLEILNLQKEYEQSQFESLKNQLNPHFLFNSLSVLASLVYADAEKAEKFIEKLSRTYRYLLDQRANPSVPVEYELNFLKNFEFLLEQRYASKIQIKKELPERFDGLSLLPHTMLVVFENIIGTSKMSLANPVLVNLSVVRNYMIIRYSHQPKELPTLHLMQQFAALLQGYRQMQRDVIVYLDDATNQQVIRIPLLSI